MVTSEKVGFRGRDVERNRPSSLFRLGTNTRCSVTSALQPYDLRSEST